MINFENVKKACEELNFDWEIRNRKFRVSQGMTIAAMNCDDVWAVSILPAFGALTPDQKALLIKAIEKDYDKHINSN